MTAFQALVSSETNEWYTPPEFIELARSVMGGIDIDPASNQLAQQWIKASTWYGITDDGYNKPWNGRLWLNPSYGIKGKGNLGASAWIERAIALWSAGQVEQTVLLVRGDSRAINILRRLAWTCEPDSRISFIKGDGSKSDRPVPGCRFYYLGTNKRRFYTAFSDIGTVMRPVDEEDFA